MRPSVCVVMAACSGEMWIEEQIRSILSQLQKEDRLVISVDPCEDATLEIVKKKAREDSRIEWMQGPGKGIAANVEHGLLQAREDIVFLSDQDDVWPEGKVGRVLEMFADPGVVMAVHDAAICDRDLNITAPSFFKAHTSRPGFWNNIARNSYVGACMAFRREILDQALPFPASIPMHDQWLGLVSLRMGKTVWLEEPLLLYRRHGNNASSLSPSGLKQMVLWRISLLKALHQRGYV